MSQLDFFVEIASTYTYPAAMRIGTLAETAGVAVRWRPFLLGPIFKAQGFDTSPFNIFPAKGRHMWRDLERVCGALALPFRRPDPFPQNSVLAARVALVACEQGWGKEFCRAVFLAEFAEGRQIADETVIADLLRGLGQTPESVLAAARSEAIKAKLRQETEEAARLGVFGAPSFVADGELFWGNDRLEAALEWARGNSARPAIRESAGA